MKKRRSAFWSAIEGHPDLVGFALIINCLAKLYVAIGVFLLPIALRLGWIDKYFFTFIGFVFFLILSIIIDYTTGNFL